MTPTRRAMIASGIGRYADPWHPFSRTSDCVKSLLGDLGFSVRITDVDDALAHLQNVDLLVVNAGDPWRNETTPGVVPAASVDGFTRAIEHGIGILAFHSSVASLRDYPQWAPLIGAMWVPGLSFHPDADLAYISGDALPDGTAVSGFEVFDERYCRLQRLGTSAVVARHDGPHGPEPTAWVREVGATRVAVDALGHDERSFESPGHRQLVTQLVAWLTT